MAQGGEMWLSKKKQAREVFGVSNEILPDSYVDRGSLDEQLQKLLQRPNHIALRGESKCGKSWLRKKNIPDAITVQCRVHKSALDIYVDVLSQLEIKLLVEQSQSTSFKGTVEATGNVGVSILAKLGVRAAIERASSDGSKTQRVGHDVNDLRYIADIIRASERRVVVEDFHYMSMAERKSFAFDLKALWDYGVFIIIIGVWSQSNMLIYLNPDLTGRIEEIPIYWSDNDLALIIERGSEALSVSFTQTVKQRSIRDCFGNAGILQRLIIGTLDEANIVEIQDELVPIDEISLLDGAAMAYADQLNALYQQFATRVSKGIRKRKNATGIYAHAMAVILEAPDDELMKGLPLDKIFEIAHARQPRIQKANLRAVLEKFEELQVDEEGRGLVLSYNDANPEISVVDRQLLLYRKYATVKWPWENMVAEADQSGDGFDGESDEETT